jgi:hypothetical protein
MLGNRGCRWAILTLLAIAATSQNADAKDAPNGSAPAPKTTAAPLTDDVPPFVNARGGSEPLSLAISGLRSGYARIAAGRRMFGVCWNGGVGPYEVTLRDSGGDAVVHETAIDGSELVKSSKPVLFAVGLYRVDVADSAGGHAEGQFTVVEPSSPPRSQPDEVGVGSARTLSRDLTYSYEAYLSVLPLAVGRPGSDADRLTAQLCHQPQ